MRLKIASRKSDLARIQTHQVASVLQSQYPHLEIEFVFSESLGDKNQDDPLWKMPEKGVFTADLKKSLIQQEIDLVVHSWKDLPLENDATTSIAATLPRADQRDLLLIKKADIDRIQSCKRFKVLTSSPRRDFLIQKCFRELLPLNLESIECEPVRGNIPTRIRKFLEGPANALMLAKAAWDRIASSSEEEFSDARQQLRACLPLVQFVVLPLSEFPTAAAQGALAIEVLTSRSDLVELLKAINHTPTFEAVTKERQRLADFGGGCHAPMGFSVIRHELGFVANERGRNHTGVDFHQQSFSANDEFRNAVDLKKVSEDKAYPLQFPGDELFERVDLTVEVSPKANVIVARENALPDSVVPSLDRVLWASGVKTWKKLAQRGHWVNGCFDSLGEQLPELEHLLRKSQVWKKLSHSRSKGDEFQLISSYQLIPKTNTPDLQNKQYFFWMSASAFECALEKAPHIANAVHFCGLGKTFRYIQDKLGDNAQVYPVLNYQSWKKSYIEEIP